MPLDRVTIDDLNARLKGAYGPRPLRPNGDPVTELILAILSQATNDRNRDRAFAALRRAFPRWDDVMVATPEAVARVIAPAGLGPQKAPRIIEVLRRIAADPRAKGRPDLGFLATMGDDEALDYLTALPGVGPKTAACVQLFALGRPVFPVDTHIHRIATRLGLVPAKLHAAKTQQAFAKVMQAAAAPAPAPAAPAPRSALPDAEACHELHINLITHGRAVCHARRPDCAHCVLADVCPAASGQRRADESE